MRRFVVSFLVLTLSVFAAAADAPTYPEFPELELGAMVYDTETRQISQFWRMNNVGAAMLVALETPLTEMSHPRWMTGIVFPENLLRIHSSNGQFVARTPIVYRGKRGIVWGTFRNGGVILQFGLFRKVLRPLFAEEDLAQIQPAPPSVWRRCGNLLRGR